MIEQDKGTIRAVAWTELFPWLIIARSFRLAISLRSLVLGAVGILLMLTGWGVISIVFSPSESFQPDCPWNTLANVIPNTPAMTLQGLAKTTNSQSIWQPGDPITDTWCLLTVPSRQGILTTSGKCSEAVCILLQGLWGVMVWAFFGAAICRTAAVQLAANEQVGCMAALRFAFRKWPSFVAAPLLPVGGVMVITLFIMILGWIMRADSLIVLGGCVWPFVLVGGFIMTLLLLGLLFGWPLMWATISTEGTDSFDALSRSYAYTFQRPLHFLFYAAVAAFLGWLGWILVQNFAAGIVWMSYWAAGWGCGSDQINSILGQGTELSGLGWFGAGMIRFFAGCVKLLAVGFLFSYFWTASSSIYLLLRRDVDATEMDEVYLDSDASEQESGLPAIAKARPTAQAENDNTEAANGNGSDES
jgi:hypothetical protein